jgi:hypothetical protein
MDKKFNLSRYKELIELNGSGRILLLDSNWMELVEYSTSVGYQLIYERKKDYFSLIDNYLNGTLSLLEFRTQFIEMEGENHKKSLLILECFQELEDFYLAEDLEEFSRLIASIRGICEDYYVLEPIPETDFYFSVSKDYCQLQEAFPVKIWTPREYQDLISRSFKFLLFIIVLKILLIIFS